MLVFQGEGCFGTRLLFFSDCEMTLVLAEFLAFQSAEDFCPPARQPQTSQFYLCVHVSFLDQDHGQRKVASLLLLLCCCCNITE